jgi:SprB repeat
MIARTLLALGLLVLWGTNTLAQTQLSVSISGTNVVCQGGSTQLTASANGGLAPYQYLWANGENAASITVSPVTNLTYTVTVTDAVGTTATASRLVMVDAPVVTSQVVPTACGQSTGSITWSGVGVPAPAPMTNLAAGIYAVTVTSQNGCTTVAQATVPATLDATITATIQGANCSLPDGAIDVSVTPTDAYTYDWADLPGSTNIEDRQNLALGFYTVTVSNTTGCTASNTFTVNQSGTFFDVQATLTNIDCSLQQPGAIQLTVNAPAEYQWSNGATTQSVTNLVAGAYTVTITDPAGVLCTTVKTYTLIITTTINVSLVSGNVACFGINNGVITVVASGGVSPYTYFWSIPGPNTATVGNLGAGTYTVTVTDANGCTKSASSTITQPPLLNITSTVTPVNCAGGPTGVIAVVVSGGVSPYTFLWTNGATTPVVGNLAAGTYTVTVTDANGCTRTHTSSVIITSNIFITSNVIPAGCNGAGGSIQLNVSGGGFSYSYLWSTGATTPFIMNLVAGTYTVTVTDDSNGCTSIRTFILPDNSIVVTGVFSAPTCNAPGSINCTVSGGTAPYTFFWPNGATTANLTNLAAGTYTVTVTDATGCTATAFFAFNPPIPITVSMAYCDNTAFPQVSGGTLPYSYLWSGGPAGPTFTGPFAQIPIGATYSLIVTDANGCVQALNVTMPPNTDPCTYIEGYVKRDSSNNCVPELTEPGLSGIYLTATNGNTNYWAITDQNGYYRIRVPNAPDYIVAPVTLPTQSVLCQPTTQLVSVPNVGDIGTANFAVQGLPVCPNLEVTLITNIMRRCSLTTFVVYYCNNGTSLADEVYVDVEIDANLSVTSATQPYVNLGNNVYRFLADDVAPGQCDIFSFKAYVPCTLQVDQTLCAEATIYPHDTCWYPYSGGFLTLSSVCEGDSLRFVLKNAGNAPTTNVAEYIVIEDGIMTMSSGSSGGVLAAGEEVNIKVPANGSTWRMEATQDPQYPGTYQPELSVEGCTSSGSFSTGYLLQFPVQSQGPWQDVACGQIVAAYDPNDKLGLPLGYGPNNYIEPGTWIDYRIRFQNTGNDTAFAVVIRDTLSQWFDLSTLRPGASSHPYKFEFVGPQTIMFDFVGIMLPDSNVNLEGSQGFVNFNVRTLPTTPLETLIENSAAIYFDINPPIITNTTTHRVGRDFVSITQWLPEQPQYKVQVVPQPMLDEAWITVKGLEAAPSGEYDLLMYDAKGSLLMQRTSDLPQFKIGQDDLRAGNYWFTIRSKGVLIGSGQLVRLRD